MACQTQITNIYNGNGGSHSSAGCGKACSRQAADDSDRLRAGMLEAIAHPTNQTEVGGHCLSRPDLCVGYQRDLHDPNVSPEEMALIIHCDGSAACLQEFGLAQGFMGSSFDDALTPQAKTVIDQFMFALVPLGTTAKAATKLGGLRSCQIQMAANSFDPNTPVLMADGSTKPIKDIEIGDEVTATDPDTGTTRPERVTALYDNLDTDLVDLAVVDSHGKRATIHTTQEHPFWDATAKRWTLAAALESGARLRSTGSAGVRVVSVQRLAQRRHMLNLAVDSVHTYYVLAGNMPVLVHNDNPAPIPKADDPKLQNFVNALYKARIQGFDASMLRGDGTAMASASSEVNGEPPLWGRNHPGSTAEYARGIWGWSNANRDATANDKQLASSLLHAIGDAQNGKYKGFSNYTGLGGCA